MSHSPWSESWRARETSGVSQAGSNCLRTRGADGVSPGLSLRALEPGTLMSAGRGGGGGMDVSAQPEKANLFFLCLVFYSRSQQIV